MAAACSHGPNARLLTLLPVLIFAVLTLSSMGWSPFATGPNGLGSPAAALGSSTVGTRQVLAAEASLLHHEGPASVPRGMSSTFGWTHLLSNNSTGVPPARQLESMAYDPVDGYVVMFGGGNVNAGLQFNDTWTFANGTWTQLNLVPSPEVRRSASLVWDAADGYLVLFGGLNPGSFLGNSVTFQDTWTYLNGTWTNRTAATVNATNTPSIRWNAQMAYDPARGATILFGGCNQLACAASTNDTWAYAAGTWTDITSTVGAAPSTRGTGAMVWYPPDNAVLLHGGSTPAQTVLNDTWELGGGGWTQLTPTHSPPARGDSWIIYNNATSSAVLFGGLSYTLSPSSYARNDTWSFGNGTWTNVTSFLPTAPQPLWGLQHSGAYDPVAGCGLLFGGADTNDVNYADTWEFGCSIGSNPGSGSGGSGGGGNGSGSLSLSVTPTVGTSPLFFNVTARLWTTLPNWTANYSLFLSAGATPFTGSAWNDTIGTWDGSLVTVAGMILGPGSYQISGTAIVTVGSTATWVATTNVSLTVLSPTPPPPSVSMALAPSNGSAPLNVSIGLAAWGGSAPYSLSVRAVGPQVTNGTGGSTIVGTIANWNGSGLTFAATLGQVGNYTIVANLSDALGQNASAWAIATVGSAPSAPMLTVQASRTSSGLANSAGQTLGFLTTVTGGAAPYDVQWTFGDGASGSAIVGGVVHHTYTRSGTYVAVLTVTDARGFVASSQVGPFTVELPLSPAPSGGGASGGALLIAAVIVGLAGAAAIAITVPQLVRRREALNWLDELERRPTSEGRETGPE